MFNTPRVLTVSSPAIPVLAGQPALVPLKLEGSEGVNSLFEYRLTLQTPDAMNFMGGQASNFDLDAFVGLELTCYVELEGHGSFAANQGAGVREISGLITAARKPLSPARRTSVRVMGSPALKGRRTRAPANSSGVRSSRPK
jgi:type VI secretion system secreted protein VgrG